MLRRCVSKTKTGDGGPTEIDSDDLSEVIIIDGPECFHKKNQQPGIQSLSKKCLPKKVICIDDDDNDGDILSDSSIEESFSSSKTTRRVSDEYSDDCQFVQEIKAPLKQSKSRASPRRVIRNRYGLVSDPETSSSDSDCELISESFGKLREEWEKASSKRNCRNQNAESQPELEQTGENNCSSSLGKASEEKEHVSLDAGGNDSFGASSSGFPSFYENCAEDMNLVFQDKLKDPYFEPCVSKPVSGVKSSHLIKDGSLGKGDCSHEDLCSSGDENGNERCSSNSKPSKKSTHRSSGIKEKHLSKKSHCEHTNDNMHIFNNCITGTVEISGKKLSYDEENDEGKHVSNCSTLITERERFKETDDYKKALEEELASRQRALQIQAEEARQMRRLVKRRKAERMRLLDMERRQKQRLDEMRETQKKDEENMSTKDLIRNEVRRELSKLETACHDMASVLQGLGIPVPTSPSPDEVRAAYKKALLTFHPDRASKGGIRQQVEAEEKFKLISRMKDKFMGTSR